MNTDEKLKKETEKWKERLEDIKIEPLDKDGRAFVKNINAYIKDTDYFMEKKDYIRAFEAIIWAWAWLEIGVMKKIIRKIKG